MISISRFMIGLVAFFLFTSCTRKETLDISVLSSWQFRQDTSKTWLHASVPGCVHTDLLANGKISDPFFGDNEQKLQWIGESNWDYINYFNASELMDYERIELVFDGLDTYAEVFLNDSLILNADNMFRQWVVEVKDLLLPDSNELIVRFTAPEKIEKEKAAKLAYRLPDKRGFTRKAPYQYGWDWGPKFVTIGIWQPVYLRCWSDLRLTDLHIFTEEISNGIAVIGLEAEIESTKYQTARIEYQVNNEKNSIRLNLKKGLNNYKTNILIENPRLWWPKGMGEQPIYDLNLTVKTDISNDVKNAKFGIRKIELVKEKDFIGETFHFKINDVPFFAKGANYIPQDNFPPRVTNEKYRQTIQKVVDANMNMLRAWGGGFYEKDIFYDLCDEYGILVWQDFIFACNMYPGDSAFLESVKQEAAYQVKRLRNHPSLALWCGNNEVDEGWKNWGWQKSLNYSEQDSTEVWINYLQIFKNILPETVFTLTPHLPYIPSSPKIGWGHEESLLEGDMHYWGVWWGEEPFEMYEEKVGRFMSEYGFQGFPDLRTLDSCLHPEDRTLNSPALLNHQKHPKGMELIEIYMGREYTVPDDYEDYVYVSQLVQAYGIKKAIEAHRRAMPRCMGTLYWQLNDCWPVISWSSLDYDNRWKALHYFVKEAYKEVMISINENNNSLDIFIVSDLQYDLLARLELKIIDFEGNVKWKSDNEIQIGKTSSEIFKTVDTEWISKTNHALVSRIMAGDSLLAEDVCYFLPPKDLNLPKANISLQTNRTGKGYQVKLITDKLAKNVYLSIDEDGLFSDNYFDLLPGDSIVVRFIKKSDKLFEIKPIYKFEERLKIKTLYDTYTLK